MESKPLKLQETMGSYFPHFLEMYINTEKIADLNVLDEMELSTFFHEWIHFIQDLTTSFGCYNAYVYFEKLFSMGKKAMQGGEEISVPITIDNNDNVLTNEYINRAGWGTTPQSIFTDIIKCENQNVPVPADLVSIGAPTEIPRCFVKNNRGETFEFGALQIMESMAYLCQCQLFPDTAPNHPVHPYHIATQVAELYSKEFASCLLNVIALCDMSLMYSVPGVQFTSYLSDIKNGKIALPNAPEDVYAYFCDKNCTDNYINIEEMTRSHFKGILKDPKAFYNYHKWIDNAYDLAKGLRINETFFILDLLRGGELKNNAVFRSLYQDFGTPLIRNNKGEYSKTPVKGNQGWDVEYMQPIRQLGCILTGKTIECGLWRWCIDSANELLGKGDSDDIICKVDERCKTNPSLRSIDKVKCPMGFVWYATGLPLVKNDIR